MSYAGQDTAVPAVYLQWLHPHYKVQRAAFAALCSAFPFVSEDLSPCAGLAYQNGVTSLMSHVRKCLMSLRKTINKSHVIVTPKNTYSYWFR